MLRALLSPLVSVPGTPLYASRRWLPRCLARLDSQAERRIPESPVRAAPGSPGSVAETSAWSGRGWPSSEERGVNST